LDHRQVKIADDGEILVKGKTLCRGYISKRSLELDLDEQGYFHTADVGYIKDGNLFVIGRKDLMFISGGENIFPEEIEKALDSIEQIAQAIVVPADDRLLGQRPVAFVKTQKAKPLDTAFIEKSLRKNMEGFKVPIAFFPWPKDIEMSLKPNRKAFRDHAAKLITSDYQ
jgi:O-succinylbenzoic acid--CoA ligase